MAKGDQIFCCLYARKLMLQLKAQIYLHGMHENRGTVLTGCSFSVGMCAKAWIVLL